MNCVNCGAPIDTTASKCPYCETPYKKDDSNSARNLDIVMDCSGLAMAVSRCEIISRKKVRKLLF